MSTCKPSLLFPQSDRCLTVDYALIIGSRSLLEQTHAHTDPPHFAQVSSSPALSLYIYIGLGGFITTNYSIMHFLECHFEHTL